MSVGLEKTTPLSISLTGFSLFCLSDTAVVLALCGSTRDSGVGRTLYFVIAAQIITAVILGLSVLAKTTAVSFLVLPA